MTGSGHEPVLAGEVLEFLGAEEGGLFADCTLGPGGHSEKILESSPDSRVVGIDCDEEAVRAAAERLKRFGERFFACRQNYFNLDEVLAERGLENVDGILLDLGVSSVQLDDEKRGFSFMKDAPLDMRLDRSAELNAAELVNGLPEKELADIFRKFGEEPRAEKIAARIVRERKSRAVDTTGELADIVLKVYGGRGRRHPATRVFQALRIAVNRELEVLDGFLGKALPLLAPGGRLCVISYHSLEDRIAKNRFRSLKEAGNAELPVKKPVTPSRTEILRNRRSRSAKLRVIERSGK